MSRIFTLIPGILLTYSDIVRVVHIISHGRRGGGVTCYDFGYGRAAGVSGPYPIHILGEVKNIPIRIHPIAKIVPIHILFLKIYPFIYFLGEKDTPLIYF